MAGVAVSRRRRPDDAPRRSWRERNLPALTSVKRIELIVFSRQMATFIRAGIPVLDGIRVVRDQTASGTFRRALDDIASRLREGERLSVALGRHPAIFSRLYLDMVVAAEATGELEEILNRLATYLERSESTSRKVRQAMLYPSIVAGLAVVVVFILITFVLPAFGALFADFDAELPLPTQILLALGSLGGQYGLLVGAALLFVATLIFLVRNSGPVRRLRHRAMLRIPIVGNLVRLGIATRFARMFGILLHAGVPVTQALDIATAGTDNHVFRKGLAPVRDRLLAGDTISGPLAASRLFNPLLVQMIKVGEETGTLDRYLEQAADFMDDDLEYRTKQMVTLIEPLMIVGVALVVGFVALSVVTPMYTILQHVR